MTEKTHGIDYRPVERRVRVGTGTLTVLCGAMRMQFYWPSAQWTKTDKWLLADTRIRVFSDSERGNYGAGFQLFGFGFGADYENPNV